MTTEGTLDQQVDAFLESKTIKSTIETPITNARAVDVLEFLVKEMRRLDAEGTEYSFCVDNDSDLNLYIEKAYGGHYYTEFVNVNLYNVHLNRPARE